MIGMVLGSVGTPFAPWQELQTCSLASMSSAALAGMPSAAAKMSRAGKVVGRRLLIMFYTPWFEARPGANRETIANHAAVGLVAQGLDALAGAAACSRKTFSRREKTPQAAA